MDLDKVTYLWHLPIPEIIHGLLNNAIYHSLL